MKKFKIFLSFTILLLLINVYGCSQNREEEYTENYNKLSNKYSFEDFEKKKIIKNPFGLVIFNDKLIACDFDKNCLIIYSLDGKYEKSIGSTGNGELEFLNPIDVTKYNNDLYVLDSGNERIQILNSDFTLKKILELKELGSFNNYYRYSGITVSDKGEIYVDTVTSNKEVARILYMESADKEWIQLSKSLFGSMKNCEGKVYAVDRMSFGEQSASSWSVQAGVNNLYSFENKICTKVMRLPDKLMPWQFIVKGKELYIITAGDYSLQHWTLEGEYQETLFKFPQEILEQGSDKRWDIEYNDLEMDEEGNFYLSLDKSGIYKISKN